MHALHEWLAVGSFFGDWFSAEWFAESISNAWVRLGIDSAAKATLLLLLALLATTLWRRSSAALRHRIWCLTFAGLVILPVLSAALPAWRLPILPVVVNEPLPEAELERVASESPVVERVNDRFADVRRLEEPRPAPLERGPRVAEAAMMPPPMENVAEIAPVPPVPAARSSIGLPALWLLGVALALSPLAVGLARNWLVRWRARPMRDAGWAVLLDELRGRLMLRRRVTLLETDAAVMPMTWGLVSPVVLLPRQARQWAERLRRFVLLHELAHVKRGDVGFQMLARVACAVYWFHPLAWLALRRLRIERELACDDCVLSAGERPSDYAAELLRVAHDYRPPRLAAAVAMAQRGSLEHRIRALLDRARSHLPMSARSARVLLVLAAAIVTAVAVVRPGPRAVGDEENAEAAAEKKSSSPADEADEHRVHGRVVDENGQPLAGARVCVVRTDTEMSTWMESGRLLADAQTDASGRFDIQHLNDTPRLSTPERFIYPTTLYVLAFADGRALDWVVVEPGDRRELVLRLLPDSVAIEGQVVDLEGRPISGVRVNVNELTSADGDLDRWIKAAGRNPAAVREEWAMMRPKPGEERPTVARFPGRKNIQLGLPDLLPAAVTDATGRYRLEGLGADRLARLELSGSGIAKTWVHAVTRAMPAVPYPVHDPRFRAGTCFGSRFVMTAEPDQPIQGMVTDADTGAPLAGVEVRLNQYAESRLFVEGFLTAITDEQGRYTLSGVPKPSNPGQGALLRVVPRAGHPYFRTAMRAAKADGLAPVQADVRLKRAVRLRGHVRDAATGQPLRGMVSYFPFLTNQAAEAFDNFEAGAYGDGDDDAYAVSDDGAFEIPAVPGRGVVCFIAQDDGYYPRADGAADIADLIQAGSPELGVYHLTSAELMTAVREVVVPAEATEAVSDIEVRPLPVAKVRLVDEAGEPVVGALARGLTPPRPLGLVVNQWPSQPLSSDVAEVVGIGGQQERTLLFLHRGRQLATAVRISDGKLPERVVLRPCASIVGRVVDATGRPVREAFVRARVSQTGPGKGPGEQEMQYELPGQISDGRFRFDFVPPGIEYQITAKLAGKESLIKTTAPLEPGETLDLGDLVLPPNDAASDDGPGTASADAPLGYGAATFESTSLREVRATTDGVANKAASPNDNAVTLRGRAIGPDDKPLTAVKFYLRYANRKKLPALPLGESGADGRFELHVDKASLDTSAMPDPWPTARLLAIASGLGFQTIDALSEKTGELTVRLPRDVPIHGRIITLEGRPVAGAKVSVSRIARCRGDQLDECIEAYRAGRVPFDFESYEQVLPGMPENIIADSQGKFTLRGFGAERVVELSLEGPEIEFTRFDVMTRESAPISQTRSEGAGASADRAYGATFEYIAAPARKIVGTVRDHETGQPLSGVTIRSRTSHAPQTDAAGHFELLGLAKADAYYLCVYPKETGYFSAALEVKDTPGLAPLPADVELVRGMVAEGRVTVAGMNEAHPALVEYHPLYPNPYVARLGKRAASPCAATTCDADGNYRLPVLPGPGVLAFRADGGQYYERFTRALVTRDDLAKLFGDEADHGDEQMLSVALGVQRVTLLAQSSYNRLILIKPGEDAVSLRQDAQLEVGRTVDGTLVGPDDEPLAGVRARGLTGHYFEVDELPIASFTVKALHPRLDRELIFEHRESQLAAAKTIHGDEPGPLTIRLAPCGSVVGRILDAEGQPLADKQLSLGRPLLFPPEFTPTTDSSGRFRVERLVPGLKYALRVENGPKFATTRDVVVAAGETKDLGDVAPSPPDAVPDTKANAAMADPPLGKAAPAATGVSAVDEKATAQPTASVLRGRVLAPNGEPAIGAGLYWRDVKSPAPPTADGILYTKRATTDEAGRFELPLAASDVPPTAVTMKLIAKLPGFGLDWVDVTVAEPEESTLRLVEDRPIRGRVIDTEGRPLAGVPIRLDRILASDGGKLDDFLNVWQQDWRMSWSTLKHALYPPLGTLLGTATDEQGRFELSGIGRERVATVVISPPGYVSREIRVVHRAGFDAAKYNQAAHTHSRPMMLRQDLIPRLVGPEFDHVAETELVAQGTVFTEPNHTPLKGVFVGSASGGWAHAVSTQTDKNGHYELHGLPRGEQTLVTFRPAGDGDLISRTLSVVSTAGEIAMDLDVELKRGIVVEGRVFDNVTSRGVKGGVRFVPLPGNAFVDQPGYDGYKHSRVSESTDADGRFRIIVPPGAGVMIAQIYGGNRLGKQEIKPYRQASFTAAERERVGVTEDDDDRRFTAADQSLEFLSNENAVKVIDLPPGSEPFVCDLPVDPGKTVEMAIEDDQGLPLRDVSIAGITDGWPHALKIAEPRTTIFALGPDRPRRVCILHPKRRLAASLTLTGDEPGLITARLAPSATIAGRVLDDSGAPIAGAIVQINYTRRSASELDRFVGLESPATTTDDDGRFRVENVLPDERFALDFKQQDHYFRAPLTDAQRRLAAGQTLELGETRAKQIR